MKKLFFSNCGIEIKGRKGKKPVEKNNAERQSIENVIPKNLRGNLSKNGKYENRDIPAFNFTITRFIYCTRLHR